MTQERSSFKVAVYIYQMRFKKEAVFKLQCIYITCDSGEKQFLSCSVYVLRVIQERSSFKVAVYISGVIQERSSFKVALYIYHV